MSQIRKEQKGNKLKKTIDFAKQMFVAILRSRKGSFSEYARILRYQNGSKSFERQVEIFKRSFENLKTAYFNSILNTFTDKGIKLGIIDDTFIKKCGKKFPKQKIDYDHVSKSFFSGMRILSSTIYQNGKTATVSSYIAGKNESKIDIAKSHIISFKNDFNVDVFLFDSWYCQSPILNLIKQLNSIFVSRVRANNIVLIKATKMQIKEFAKKLKHTDYQIIKIKGKSYWIYEKTFEFQKFGKLRVIISKEGRYKEPVFIVTNSQNFSNSFIVKLYMRRFSIEVFFKDAKQFLNFETLFSTKSDMWDFHLLITNILHWAIQKKNSISKQIFVIRETITKCALFINKNHLLQKLFDELLKICLT